MKTSIGFEDASILKDKEIWKKEENFTEVLCPSPNSAKPLKAWWA